MLANQNCKGIFFFQEETCTPYKLCVFLLFGELWELLQVGVGNAWIGILARQSSVVSPPFKILPLTPIFVQGIGDQVGTVHFLIAGAHSSAPAGGVSVAAQWIKLSSCDANIHIRAQVRIQAILLPIHFHFQSC